MTPRLAFAFLSVVLAAAACSAQTNLASISGIVSDPQGAVVPAAKVMAMNVATGVPTSTQANSAGFYVIPNLPAGTYTLAVEHPGFRKYVREGITLTIGERLGLDIALEVGATEQSITVTAEAPLVADRTSDLATVMEPKSVEGLPLSNRKPLSIVAGMGAVVFAGYPITPSGSPSFSLAGGRGRSQMAYIDGGSVQNSRIGNPLIDSDVPVDAVQEVKVLMNNYSAEYGASAGGVVITNLKSGTNQLHGTAYEYFRNDAMDAPGFFAPIQNGQKVSPELRYNVFGATAGGPIRKDKTFFFVSYEGVRVRNGSTIVLTVPTLLQRKGDFSQTFNTSGSLIRIFDPATTTGSGSSATRQQYPSNMITQIDPVAAAVLGHYPLPNRAPTNLAGANNFSGNRVTVIPSDSILAKFEHNFRAQDRVTFRYLRLVGTASIVSPYPNSGAGDPGPGSDFSERWALRIFGNWTHVVSTAQVNDFRFAYNDRLFHQLSAGLGGGFPSKLGLKGVPDTAFPNFAPAGFSPLGSTSQERVESPIRTEQFIDNYSWTRGRHAMKFGAEVRRSFHGDVQSSTISGSFAFSAQGTGLPGNSSTGNGLATMLAGFDTGFTQVQTDHLFRHMYYFAAFAQDDWTIRPSLTLNLGLRWETDTPMIDDDNHMNSFDLNQINAVSNTPGVVKFMGVNGFRTSPYDTRWRNFGPRFGFAWKPFAKTVIRAGGGLFFAHPFDDSPGNTVALGFGTQRNLTTPDSGVTPAFYLRNGVPALTSSPALNDSFGAVPVGQATTTSVNFFDPHRGVGYAEQFNLGIQRELPANMLLEITGFANLSRKFANSPALSLNQIPPQVLSAQHFSQRDRPFPQFTDVAIQFPTLGTSSYYAGMIRVQKRYSAGLNFGAAYTWSKYLGNISQPGTTVGNNAGIYSNYYNRRADYGPTSNDITHVLHFHWVYELPFGSGKRWLAGSPLRFVVGGWSIGNVSSIQSGPANTPTTNTNSCMCFSAGAQRPDVVGGPDSGAPRTVAQWFNTGAFKQPANFTLGNAATGIIRGPGVINLDFSLIRNFRISERIRTELRGEFFNALNHTNLGNPNTVFGSPSFGVISSAGPARQIEVGAHIVF